MCSALRFEGSLMPLAWRTLGGLVSDAGGAIWGSRAVNCRCRLQVQAARKCRQPTVWQIMVVLQGATRRLAASVELEIGRRTGIRGIPNVCLCRAASSPMVSRASTPEHHHRTHHVSVCPLSVLRLSSACRK
jgi:hypothetical protein